MQFLLDNLGLVQLAGVAVAVLLMIWAAAGLLAGLVSGWSRLAEAYRFSGEYRGTTLGWQSASLRYFTNYNFCLTVGAGPQGLYMAGPWILRLGHPTLLIPWTDLSAAQGAAPGAVVTLRAMRAPEIPIRISARLFARLEPYLGADVRPAA